MFVHVVHEHGSVLRYGNKHVPAIGGLLLDLSCWSIIELSISVSANQSVSLLLGGSGGGGGDVYSLTSNSMKFLCCYVSDLYVTVVIYIIFIVIVMTHSLTAMNL